MWFWFSLAALLCWSFSDLFSKLGCADARDRYSHLKMVMAVGIVMGLHAAYEIVFGGVILTADVFLNYLPVSGLYIFSMAIGYLGLRYLELSITSPICNSSGALVAILTICVSGIGALNGFQLGAVALVCVGMILLGIVEVNEDETLRAARQEHSNYKYTKSWVALAIPLLYCLLDALGTFSDSLVLERLDEDAANVAYELTFFLTGCACAVYVLGIRKQKLLPKAEAPKYAGALFETAGQFAYIFAIADSDHVALSAPMISAYCALSVIWSRIFLREKLSKKHYASIALVIAGIIILGFFDT